MASPGSAPSGYLIRENLHTLSLSVAWDRPTTVGRQFLIWLFNDLARDSPPPRLPEPLVVTRRVSIRGAIMVGGQKTQVGLAHARKTAEVTVEADTYQIAVEPGITITITITITAPRTTSRDIKGHKASNYQPG